MTQILSLSSKNKMGRLAELAPLRAIDVPNAGRLDVRGLTVVTGPNSSGKTQFLKDIQSRFLGEARRLVVCDNIEITLPESFEEFVTMLRDEGHVKQGSDQNGNVTYQTLSPHLGIGAGGWTLNSAQLNSWHHEAKHRPPSPDVPNQFLKHVGQLIVTSLFLDRRLTLTNETGHLDYVRNPPTSELQALYLNRQARAELSDEIARTFGKAIWLDQSRGNVLCLRVHDCPQIPSAEDRLEPSEMAKYRTIEFEGDGLKSYVCICMSLLLGRRPVQLIDEPEMCLHPPQAYALGRFIGTHATSKEQAIYVATHSSHVLRGILETTDQLQILRLYRSRDRFHGHLIPYDTLKACLERPSTKAEAILDGIFSEAVTIVESEGDRLVYEAATDNIADDFEHDVHFVSVGGIGGIASTSSLYRQLRIPQVVIADLDLLLKPDTLYPIVLALSTTDVAKSIVDSARQIAQIIRAIGPSVTSEHVRARLNEILAGALDWNAGDDEAARRTLGELSRDLSRTNIIKHGGLENFRAQNDVYAGLKKILGDCRQIGLFLVPVGELEYWEPELMKDGPGKGHKAEWANSAALRIRKNGKQTGGIHEFVSQMCRYQQDSASKNSGYPV